MKTESYPLNTLFDFPSIKGLTEDFIRRNPGNIPVFGGRMKGNPIGYVADDLSNVNYFENCLGWNREGSVGYVFHHECKFTTNDHHRPLILKKEYVNLIDLDYVAITLEEYLLSLGFSWSKTASKTKVSQMNIDIPITEDGDIDIDAQRLIASRKQKLRNLQTRIGDYYELLSTHLIEIPLEHETKNVSLDEDYFSLSIGKRFLKKDILNQGIPIYSANPQQPFGFVKKSNIEAFGVDSLLWGIDGNFTWNYIAAHQKFATTDHCGCLRITNPGILPEYLFYQLSVSAGAYGFNRTYRASLKNISIVTVPIPVDIKGEFDTNAQQAVIQRYRSLNQTKKNLLSGMQTLTYQQIDVS